MGNSVEINSLSDFISKINKFTQGTKLYEEIIKKFITDHKGDESLYSFTFLVKEATCITNLLYDFLDNRVDPKFGQIVSVLTNIIRFFNRTGFSKAYSSLIESVTSSTDEMIEQYESRKISEFSVVPFTPIQFYFRGEANTSWDTLPSTLRDDKNWSKESFYYHEIQVRSPKDFENHTYLNRLVTMQHYNCPTRLLDITANPLNALYFACEDESQMGVDGKILFFPIMRGTMSYGDADKALVLSCIPHLTKHEQEKLLDEVNGYKKLVYDAKPVKKYLNKLLLEICSEKPAFQPRIEFGDLLNPLFVQPNMTNPRIINQQGAFLLSGLCADKTEAKNKINARIAQTQIIIPANRKKEILAQLDSIGINKGTIYPNMEKIADYLKHL